MSLINEEKDLVYLCRYQIASLVFMLQDEKIEMDPSNVISIEKVDDYEFNIRSILKVSLRLDTRKKLWLLKNKRDIICKFELDKIGMDRESEEFNTGNDNAWNLEFCIYFNDDNEAIDTNTFESSLIKNEDDDFASNNINDENYFESQNTLDVYLFTPKLLNASKKIYNEVYTTGTMQQFVGRLLTATGHPKVLMSRIENSEVYSELLIPAYPAYKALIYLDQYYGLYKTGAIIYYDIDLLYVLNSNGKLTAKQENEWVETTFLISAMDNSTPGNGMVRKPEEKVYYINIPETNISPQKPSIAKNESLGSEAKIVISDDTTIDIAEANQSYMDQRNEFIRYIRKDDNKYTTSILKARMEENECMIYINGDNFDINAFTPNKLYQLVFEETSKQELYGKYKYRIAYAYHFIRAETESHMVSSHRIVLKKCAE